MGTAIYELRGLRSAMGGWDFTIETDAGIVYDSFCKLLS